MGALAPLGDRGANRSWLRWHFRHAQLRLPIRAGERLRIADSLSVRDADGLRTAEMMVSRTAPVSFRAAFYSPRRAEINASNSAARAGLRIKYPNPAFLTSSATEESEHPV